MKKTKIKAYCGYCDHHLVDGHLFQKIVCTNSNVATYQDTATTHKLIKYGNCEAQNANNNCPYFRPTQ